jgi:hypothetical protein
MHYDATFLVKFAAIYQTCGADFIIDFFEMKATGNFFDFVGFDVGFIEKGRFQKSITFAVVEHLGEGTKRYDRHRNT